MSGDTTLIHKLMDQAKVIGLLWSTEDVQNLAEEKLGKRLTESQAWEVLESVDIRADLGVSWDVIEIYTRERVREHDVEDNDNDLILCDRCGKTEYENIIIDTEDGSFCDTCFDEWRKEAI